MSIGMNEKMININLFLRYHAAKLLKIREKWIFCRNGMKKVFIIINNFSAYQKVMNYNLVKFFYIMLQKLLRYFLCCIKFFAKNKEFKYYQVNETFFDLKKIPFYGLLLAISKVISKLQSSFSKVIVLERTTYCEQYLITKLKFRSMLVKQASLHYIFFVFG